MRSVNSSCFKSPPGVRKDPIKILLLRPRAGQKQVAAWGPSSLLQGSLLNLEEKGHQQGGELQTDFWLPLICSNIYNLEAAS